MTPFSPYAAPPSQALHSDGPWWEVCAAAQELQSALRGRGSPARADKQPAAALRQLLDESHALLLAGLQRHRGLDPAQYAPLLDLVRAPRSPKLRVGARNPPCAAG